MKRVEKWKLGLISIRQGGDTTKTFEEISKEVLSVIKNNGLDDFLGTVRDIFNYVLQVIEDSTI